MLLALPKASFQARAFDRFPTPRRDSPDKLPFLWIPPPRRCHVHRHGGDEPASFVQRNADDRPDLGGAIRVWIAHRWLVMIDVFDDERNIFAHEAKNFRPKIRKLQAADDILNLGRSQII